jgi:hypothetical protein
MPLEVILDGVYSSSPGEQKFVEFRVRRHYARRGHLKKRDVAVAKLRYVPTHFFNASPALTTCRSTGWHGESGIADSGGHVTVDFMTIGGIVVTTHHVYQSDGAYSGMCIVVSVFFY